MTDQQTGDFCQGFKTEADGAISFECSADSNKWPWINLHPANNIAVQCTNYFALTGVSKFRGSMDGEKWTALTSFEWRVLNLGEGAEHPARGKAGPKAGGADMDYACEFFDRAGDPVYCVSGSGVVFRNRDFKAWRQKAKDKILALPEPAGFVFAAPEDAGVATAIECFVSPLKRAGDVAFADALVTKESGFAPAHPYHGGSGDHVNSGHLCDAAQQAAFLVRKEKSLKGYPKGGKVKFSRYVELDRPFRLTLSSGVSKLDNLAFRITQADNLCAELKFFYEH